MPKYQRIMHSADPRVNDCLNEFLVASASRVPELRDKGFREVGRTYGLRNQDFATTQGWIPNIPIVPVGKFVAPDSELDLMVRQGLGRLFTEIGGDEQAVDLGGMTDRIVSAVPTAGNLYLVDFQYSDWGTNLHHGNELILMPQGEGEPVYKTNPKHGLHIFDRRHRGDSMWKFIEPAFSRIPYLLKNYPFKVNEIRMVGELEVAPVFLGKVRTSPRMGWTGSSEYAPRLSRYADFERHLQSKK
ncbi:MAG: hypothetical protein PHF67_02175 [Candidatus Nanoarchaeia archaeon]|nr:hypothetical protein [Candidatus Nanoarchaeia archaeon]